MLNDHFLKSMYYFIFIFKLQMNLYQGSSYFGYTNYNCKFVRILDYNNFTSIKKIYSDSYIISSIHINKTNLIAFGGGDY